MVGDQNRLGGQLQVHVSLGILLHQLLQFILTEFPGSFGLECDHEIRRCEPRAHGDYRYDIIRRSASRHQRRRATPKNHETP